jgi:hypothetical protein
MRTLFGSLVTLMLCTVAVQAEVVIDDFDQATTVNNIGANSGNPVALNDGFLGNRTVAVSPGAPVPVVQFTAPGGGGVSFQNIGGGASSIAINYTGLNWDLSAGLNNLVVDFFQTVTGSWTATVSTNGGAQTTGPVAVTSGSVINFLPGVATVNSIQVVLATNSTGSITNVGSGKIVANPEPASLMLLGLTGLGGVFVARRRKKTEQAA